MINDKTKGELMMLLSCLQDIAQKIGEGTTAKQINEVQLRLQKIFGLVEFDMPGINTQLMD